MAAELCHDLEAPQAPHRQCGKGQTAHSTEPQCEEGDAQIDPDRRVTVRGPRHLTQKGVEGPQGHD